MEINKSNVVQRELKKALHDTLMPAALSGLLLTTAI